MNPADREWTRRAIFKTAVAGIASAWNAPVARAGLMTPADPERIRRENEHKGTRDWMTTNVRIDPNTKYRSPGIEGYVTHTSVRPGESISIHVSTNPGSPFVIEIYRLGYYQGHGGRFMLKLGPFHGSVQPDPPVGPKRLRECAWTPSASLLIPTHWTSGVYLGKLTAEREGVQSYVVFVVRDDRKTDFLFQVSDTTWNAYNRWPSQFSLYDDGKKVWYWGPGVQTSFDRPYGKYCQIVDAPLSVGSGEFLLWEFPLAYWMEREGYDISYISNIDTHSDPAGLRRAKGWLSVGHDEYWSTAMFQNMQKAVADGLNLAFLSGNSICGVIDIHTAGDGRPHRVIERVGRYGSPQKEELENGFPEEALFSKNGPNEATLIGARSTYPVTGGGDWTCRKPSHWLFAGTGMREGDGIPGLVGWEWHGDPAPLPGLEVVASGKTQCPRPNGEGTFTATIYPGPKRNFVFNAATIWWGDGLSEPPGYIRPSVYTRPRGPDPRVQRITRNLLERMKNPG
jgi:hypothetical protein